MNKFIRVIFFFIIFLNCSNIKPVQFKEYVDTSNRKIDKQTYQTFELEKPEVYISNQFSGSRVNDAKVLNDSTGIVFINPENKPINNSPYFAFKIWSSSPKTYYINFEYPDGYSHRYLPKLYDNHKWLAVDSTNIISRNNTTTLKVNLTESPLTIASQKIEDYHHVIKWSKNYKDKYSSLVYFDYYGKSVLGKKLPVLLINNGKTKHKDIIVLLTRQHPPEVTGYYAFQYFLNALTSNINLRDSFFSKYQILAFPILNPDGVNLGHWRHNANGIDTNRDWSKFNQKEIKNTVQFINKYSKTNSANVIIGLDFHSTWYDVFYTNKERKNTLLPNFIDNWFNTIEANYENYKVNEVSSNSAKPVSKAWFLKAHKAVGITFEIGDNTPMDKIERISTTAAIQMMQVLLDE